MSRPITQKQAAFLADLVELQKKHGVEIFVDAYDRYLSFHGSDFTMDVDDIEEWRRTRGPDGYPICLPQTPHPTQQRYMVPQMPPFQMPNP